MGGIEKMSKNFFYQILSFMLCQIRSKHLISQVHCPHTLIIIYNDLVFLSIAVLCFNHCSIVESRQLCHLLFVIPFLCHKFITEFGYNKPLWKFFSDNLASVFCSDELSLLHQSCFGAILWKALEMYKSYQQRHTILGQEGHWPKWEQYVMISDNQLILSNS